MHSNTPLFNTFALLSLLYRDWHSYREKFIFQKLPWSFPESQTYVQLPEKRHQKQRNGQKPRTCSKSSQGRESSPFLKLQWRSNWAEVSLGDGQINPFKHWIQIFVQGKASREIRQVRSESVTQQRKDEVAKEGENEHSQFRKFPSFFNSHVSSRTGKTRNEE